MAFKTSNVARAYSRRKFVRNQNYKGIVLNSTVTLPAKLANAETGIALFPISPGALITSLRINLPQPITEQKVVNVGVAAIVNESDIDALDNLGDSALRLIGRAADEGGANDNYSSNIIIDRVILGEGFASGYLALENPAKTIAENFYYDSVKDGVTYKVPFKSFKKVKDDVNVMLMLFCDDELPRDMVVSVSYIDGVPSTVHPTAVIE